MIYDKEKTLEYLRELELAEHKGPVVIITKGDLDHFDLPNDLNLDLHLAFSTFGITHEYDKVSHNRLLTNLLTFQKRKYKYRKSIEFRPICYGVNDSKEIIEKTFEIYHIVLENENHSYNYGIYANGILAESTDELTLMRMKGYTTINKTSDGLSKFLKSLDNNKKYKLVK